MDTFYPGVMEATIISIDIQNKRSNTTFVHNYFYYLLFGSIKLISPLIVVPIISTVRTVT